MAEGDVEMIIEIVMNMGISLVALGFSLIAIASWLALAASM